MHRFYSLALIATFFMKRKSADISSLLKDSVLCFSGQIVAILNYSSPNQFYRHYPQVELAKVRKMEKSAGFKAFLHFLIGAILSFLPFVVSAQKANPGIENFKAYKSGSKVFIRFSISAGSTCDGILIRRSVEDGNFLPIREIEGICGSDSASITYIEEDDVPVFNRQLKYFLELGRSGFSDTLQSFFTETSAAGYILTRQAEGWKILLENASGELLSLLVYDLQGKPILVTETRSDFFEVPFAKLPNALVFFRLSDSKSGIITSGKLMF